MVNVNIDSKYLGGCHNFDVGCISCIHFHSFLVNVHLSFCFLGIWSIRDYVVTHQLSYFQMAHLPSSKSYRHCSKKAIAIAFDCSHFWGPCSQCIIYIREVQFCLPKHQRCTFTNYSSLLHCQWSENVITLFFKGDHLHFIVLLC